MMKSLLVLTLCALSSFSFLSVTIAPAAAEAQQGIRRKTVSECAKDLSRNIFAQNNLKKAQKFCETYSQKTIDCATDLAQAQRLTYNFDQALKECNRAREKEEP